MTRWLTAADPLVLDDDLVVHGDNLAVAPNLPTGAFDLVYLDPPFNTGRARVRRTLRTSADPEGARVGFGGRAYRTEELGRLAYDDAHPDYLGFLLPRLGEARRVLAPHGTLYVHLDFREAYRVRPLLDELFGEDAFLNEIIWAYDYGGRPRDRWPAKHDTILVYVKQRGAHLFDQDQIERVPYLAPGLAGPQKAQRGKLPTDVWWHTIVSPTGHEKTGYPTQKPEAVLRRVLAPSSRPGDWVLDFFAGSGTTGAAAAALGRRFVLVEENPEAVAVMRARLPGATSYLDQDGAALPGGK